MSDYFQHWLDMEHKLEEQGHALPKIYCVNWFRKNDAGKFVWPGYGDNMRVLKWMIDRIEGSVQGVHTMFGVAPLFDEITWTGLPFTLEQFNNVTSIDKQAWVEEFKLHETHFEQLSFHLPKELVETKARLQKRLAA
jgi:phosphoenolpyruvate carboxykinase (GTP)